MTKKQQEYKDYIASEASQDTPLEKTKRTFKQRVTRGLMITPMKDKDKTLKPIFKKLKDDLFENFRPTKIFISEDINKIFRFFANKGHDIRISKPQLKIASKYTVSIPGVPDTEPLRVTQYIKTLRFIRRGLDPMMQNIQSLASDAKNHATEEIHAKNTDEIFSIYEEEDQKGSEHALAKKYFKEGMETDSGRFPQKYDEERLYHEQEVIADYIDHNDYQDLMIFALLGFYHFGKPDIVYQAFPPDQLEKTTVSFTLPGFHPTTISLGAFLKIIEQLNFKHLFAV